MTGSLIYEGLQRRKGVDTCSGLAEFGRTTREGREGKPHALQVPSQGPRSSEGQGVSVFGTISTACDRLLDLIKIMVSGG